MGKIEYLCSQFSNQIIFTTKIIKRMKKHLLVLTTLLLCVITGAQAEDYNLWINGVQVTDANAADLTKIDGVSIPTQSRGWLMYSPTYKSLVLDNVTIGNIGNMDFAIKSSITGLNIVVIGDCRIQGNYSTAVIEVTKDATIRCDKEYGKAYLSVFNSNADGTGIKVLASPGSKTRPNSTTLTIGDSVSITSQAAQAVIGSKLSYASTQLVFSGDQSELVAFGSKENYGCISHFSEIMLGEGYFLDTPEGAIIDGGAVKKDGSVYVSETYGACIRQGVQLNSTNFPDAHFRQFLMDKMELNEGDWLTKQLHQKKLYPQDSEIESLQGIEFFPELETFSCWNNNLSSLDLSGNYHLNYVDISVNHIKGEAMDALIESLHYIQGEPGTLVVCYQPNEFNVITTAQVEAAKAKGWKVYSYHYDGDLQVEEEYAGVEPGSIYLDPDIFPDPYFRHYLWTEVDSDPDGWLSESDVARVITFDLSNKKIKWLDGIEYFPNLMLLYCQNNQLTSLDLSKNTELIQVFCYDNQLTSLDVSGNTKLEMLICNNNQLTSLHVSSKNKVLKNVQCQVNRLDEKAMEALVSNLPTWGNASGELSVKDLTDENEQNVITPAQVQTAKQKGWTVYARLTSGENGEYNGDGYIEPIDNDDTSIDLSDLADKESLENVVVDNVYYNLTNGSYNAEDNCLVISQATDMTAIGSGEPGCADVKENFNGIIIEVNGSGVIELNCQTSGSLVLNVQVGDGAPQTVTKNERGTVEIAYNVTTPTYVYIYATVNGSAAPGLIAANVNNSISIYSLTVKPGATTGIEAIQREHESVYYTLDGRIVNRKPTQQGVYVTKGKKIVVK